MQISTYIILTHDEINDNIPYSFICETMSGSKWNTSKCKRLLRIRFTAPEREAINRLHRQAYLWHLKQGAPETLTLTTHTLLLWQQLANFCYEL